MKAWKGNHVLSFLVLINKYIVYCIDVLLHVFFGSED